MCMRNTWERYLCTVLVEYLEQKRLVGRASRRWEDIDVFCRKYIAWRVVDMTGLG